MYFISSTELTNPTIDINPTSLLPYYPFGYTLQRCRVKSIVGFVNSAELMKYIPAPCFRSLRHSFIYLEEMFLLSLICILFSRAWLRISRTTLYQISLPRPPQLSKTVLSQCMLLTVSTKRSSILMLSM